MPSMLIVAGPTDSVGIHRRKQVFRNFLGIAKVHDAGL